MVQIIKGGPSRSSMIAQLLGESLGKGLGEFTGDYFANKALDRVKNDESLVDAPQSERMSKLESALRPYGERGQRMLQSQLALEEQRQQENIQSVLSDVYEGKPVSEKRKALLPVELQNKIQEVQKKKQVGKNVEDALIKAGYPQETAAIWRQQVENATTGGATDTFKQVNDLLKRSKTGKGLLGEEEKPQLKPSIEIPGIENQAYELEFPELKQSVGRSSADIVKEETENRKINNPLYADTIDSLNSLEEDFRDFQQLQEYNMTPNALPTGAEKWNVDWDTGDLRVKALATPETQAYVKIIARLLGRAKEYFPGRVTNFDLNQFRQRFPTLANSPEGRELITKQLMIANRIAYLKDETLKAAIDYYGAEGDPTQIRKYANENYRRLKGSLENELKSLNQQAEKMTVDRENPENKNIDVIFEGKKGQMPKDQYERALKAGKKVELFTK